MAGVCALVDLLNTQLYDSQKERPTGRTFDDDYFWPSSDLRTRQQVIVSIARLDALKEAVGRPDAEPVL